MRSAPLPICRRLLAGAPFALLLACSTSSFSGSSGNATSPAGSANAVAAPAAGAGSGSSATTAVTSRTDTLGTSAAGPGAPATANQTGSAASISIPADCGAAGVTQATLLTKSVQNATAGNYLEYSLTVTDCSGKQIPFTAAKVSFDVDATVNSEANMTYTITDASNSANTLQGTLVNVQGSDLFGHTGSNFYHYETDKAVSFAAAADAITVRIDLGGLSMVPYGSTSTTALDTYLAFGATAPVESTITLTGSPAANSGGLGTIFQKL